MKYLTKLMEQNRQWVEDTNKEKPGFFENLSKQQNPEYLWIGCSDSRVPANQILGLLPGDIFVHRNVANVVVHSDLNFLSVLQYAVDVLKVKHILVCGHYGCGGIKAATLNESHGLIDNWLRHVQDVHYKHKELLKPFDHGECEALAQGIDCKEQKHAVMCELNVVEQVINVAKTTVIQDAWQRGQKVMVHACVYALSNGLLQQIAFGVADNDEIEDFYDKALTSIQRNLYKAKM
ncbi:MULTISPECIES: carbonate dehydratase [Cysteiniphilum]|uniref:Carbonic anhydrase n=1 Tax=Cysteiniphilum litorale TaxID=2056700 RepID=A0A8J2Z5S2_9GAMM|nr:MULTISPECIES: carbonate dehydratase [Cysteiniphilum]WHN66331.1 carbonate dehydratase [Cysteiniphilum sp. QT6929]GGG02309.1 carbonic anhydrase [Cysteiniphilum litorale]